MSTCIRIFILMSTTLRYLHIAVKLPKISVTTPKVLTSTCRILFLKTTTCSDWPRPLNHSMRHSVETKKNVCESSPIKLNYQEPQGNVFATQSMTIYLSSLPCLPPQHILSPLHRPRTSSSLSPSPPLSLCTTALPRLVSHTNSAQTIPKSGSDAAVLITILICTLRGKKPRLCRKNLHKL